jgi:hypothetical protein
MTPARSVLIYDATGANAGALPTGQAAGYLTGSGPVPWTPAQWSAHPGAVRIDQSPVVTELDETADVLDYERGAATLADVPVWAAGALRAFHTGARPGQRSPAVYASQDNITPVVNTLIAAGITSGIGLGVANWSASQEAATAAVENASGPFPVVWYQFASKSAYDVGVASTAWLRNVSVALPAPPPGQWLDPRTWIWKEAELTGVGLDGKLHTFILTGGTWTRIYH